MADELRLKVARCLGWTWHGERWQPPAGHDWDNVPWMLRDGLPDWPSDPGAAARDVLGEIERRGWCWCMDNAGEGIAMDIYLTPIVSAEAPTFAQALCECFVAAVAAHEAQGKDG